MPKFINYYLPPLLLAVLIFILSAIPGQDYPDLTAGGYDYSNITNFIAHIIEFGLLAFLTLRAIDPPTKIFGGRASQNKKLSLRAKVFICLILLLLFAASDEWHQHFVPGREVRLSDWLMDALGVLAGLGFYLKRQKWEIML